MRTIFDELEKDFAIKIKDKALVTQALAHTSYFNENKNKVAGDNERLEFMGDAVLQLWTTEKLFKRTPEMPEGDMTKLRSQLVREEALSEYAKELGWNKYLLLGIGEEKSGGRQRNSLLSDMFEAVLGAIYLDSGYANVANILEKVITPHISNPNSELVVDYKTKLQECIQADSRKTVQYNLLGSDGPSNAPTFEVAVVLDDIVLGVGIAGSKKKAEQLAAKQALIKLAK